MKPGKPIQMKPQKKNSTGFAGVYPTRNGKFRAQIQSRYIGTRDTLEEAVIIRMNAVKKLKSQQIEI
jgi:hypothetical protein